MGPHYVDFTFAFDTTLIRLEMTEIWPKYVAQAFLPPLNRQLRTPHWIGLNYFLPSILPKCSGLGRQEMVGNQLLSIKDASI